MSKITDYQKEIEPFTKKADRLIIAISFLINLKDNSNKETVDCLLDLVLEKHAELIRIMKDIAYKYIR